MRILTFISAALLSTFSYAQYCTTGGPTNTGDSDLGAITLNGNTTNINIPASCPGTIGLEDLTATQSADLIANTSYTLDIDFNTCGGTYGNAGEAWIDYDLSNTFDLGESIGTWSGTTPSGVQNFNFTVPTTACNGPTRIRFMQEEGGTNPLNPCNSYTWGAMIDAEVILSGGSCQITGCTDSTSFNYNPMATIDDGSCVFATEQDCGGAIPLCFGATYESPNGVSYNGIGNVNFEFSTGNTCFGTGSGMPAGEPEVNSVWYSFTVPSAGDVSFTITPNDPSIDYDWAVFDVTPPLHSCLTLHADGAVACNWSGSPGPTGANNLGGAQNEPPFAVAAGNSYVLVVTDYAASSVGFEIDFSESTANIFGDNIEAEGSEICFGDSAILSAKYVGPTFGQQIFTWSPTNLVVDSTLKTTTTVALFDDSTYFYASFKSGQCEFVDTILVTTVQFENEFELAYDSIFSPVEVEFTNLSPIDVHSYSWDFANGNTSDERDPESELYTEPGDYEVFLVTESLTIDGYACVDSSSQFIHVPDFYIPNIITPNGDGMNDFLTIRGLKENTNLNIYNRWGKLLEVVTGYSNDWEGGNLSDGQYYYVVTEQDGSVLENYKGWFTIAR